MSRSAFYRRPPTSPGQANDLGRSLSDLWGRLGRGPKPVPPPLPPPGTADPPPQSDRKPDTRTDDCVGECEDRKRCPEKTFCFNKTKFVGTPKEKVYDADLAVQEATMRTMSPGQVLQNRGRFELLGRKALENTPSARQAKSNVIASWERANPGQSWQSQSLNALHRLDMAAGGDPAGYYAMGDSSINQSIGGGWPAKADDLKQHARNLQNNNCPLMKVRFDSSASCVADPIPSTGYPE
jgi:hypothetical protein